jgi:sugar phosphate isomerase/epimerase
MKFGISPLNFKLIQRDYGEEDGINTLNKFMISNHVAKSVEMGFKHFEIILDLFQNFPIFFSWDDLRQLSNDFGIRYSCLFPTYSIDLTGINKNIRKASIKSYLKAYNTIKELDNSIEYFIINPIGKSSSKIMRYLKKNFNRPNVDSRYVKLACSSISEILQKTDIPKEKILIENGDFRFTDTVRIAKKLGVKICLNTAYILGGHFQRSDLTELLKKYYDLIGEIHLQEYSKDTFRTFAPLGQNFPVEFLSELVKRKFEGPVVFELPYEDIKLSCQYIKDNIPEIENLPKITLSK